MTEHDARVISLHQLYLSPSCRLVKLLSSRGGQTALSRCIVNNIRVEVRTAGAVRPMSQIFALFFVQYLFVKVPEGLSEAKKANVVTLISQLYCLHNYIVCMSR